MKKLREFVFRVRVLFRRERLDAEMREEMEHHLEMAARDHAKNGVTRDEARYAAQRSFGGVEQIKEHCRDERVRGFVWLEQFFQDLRHAARTLLKSRGHAAIAAATLALGIGLVTLQFSIVNAVMRGLPFAEADRLALVQPLDARGRVHEARLADIFAWRDTQRSFAQLAAFNTTSLEISGEGLSARGYRGAAFSAGVLELLGVQPIRGRAFTADDEHVDAPPVVLLGFAVWQNEFGGDPAIVGRAIRLGGEPATIVGVLPEGFGFPESEHAWVNLRTSSTGQGNRPGVRTTARLLGRLRAEATVEMATAEFDVLVRQAETVAGVASISGGAGRVRIRPVIDPDGGKAGAIALALLGVVGGVLALAGLNVANLLTARALQRGPELALRSALGANRGRLLRQLLTESTLLAVLGATGGLLLATWGVPLVNRQFAAMSDKPFWFVVTLDERVLAFAIVVTVVVGVLAGLFPALRATRRSALDLLKEGATRGSAGAGLGRLNRMLVTAQLALSSAVLIVTSVLVSALWQASRRELPFDADAVVTAELRLATGPLAEPEARGRFYDELLQRVRTLPGVTHATLTDRYPVERSGVYRAIERADGDARRGEIGPTVSDAVAAGFFRDLQIQVLEGREFLESDGPQSERVAVVNESFARMAWPGESAIGKRFRPITETRDEPWLTVVGVVANLATDRTARASAYYHVPLRQDLPARVLIYLRAPGPAQLLVRPLREVVRALSPDVPVDRPMTLRTRMQEQVGPLRIFGALGLAFGISALFLAAVGVYGVTSFAVQRRTHEFGIRLALGAKPADLLGFVFRQGGQQLALGLAVGGLLGWAGRRPVSKALSSVVEPGGAMVHLLVLAVIAMAVAVALWFPARRAARVDPMAALRAE